jgi:hypothetical protein
MATAHALGRCPPGAAAGVIDAVVSALDRMAELVANDIDSKKVGTK